MTAFAALLAGAVLAVSGAAAAERSAADLHRAHALWLAQTGDARAALTQLRLHGQDHGPLAATLYARAGMPAAAQAALGAEHNGPQARAAMRLAAASRLAAGNAEAAVAALAAAAWAPEEDLDESAPAGRYASLLARAQLLAHKPFEAKQTLYRKRQRSTLTPRDRYHLALAELRLGAQQKGADALAELGRYDGENPRRQALADQANLTLGYWLLEKDRPASAREAFLRVRMRRPLARKAMLGLGWAQLEALNLPMVVSSTDPRDCTNDPEDLWKDDSAREPPRWECRLRDYGEDRRLLDFVRLRMGKQTQYERAVLAWRRAAADGDLHNPVVAEAIAVLPFALAAAGDKAGAEQAFRQAIARLEQARAGLAPNPQAAGGQPGSAAARLLASVRAARARLATEVATLEQAKVRPPRIATALENLGRVLAQLRREDGSFAAPGPLQRGELRLGLATLGHYRSNRAASAPRIARIEQRIERLRGSIDALSGAVHSHGQRIARQRQAALDARLRDYLRQARTGLAMVLHLEAP